MHSRASRTQSPGRIKDSLSKVASRSTSIFTLCVQAQLLASHSMRRSHHQAGVSMTIRCKITRRLDVCLVHGWRSSYTGLQVAFPNSTKHTPGLCTVHVCPPEKATWPSNGIAVRWEVVRAGGLCAWHRLREGKGDSLFPRSSIPRHIFLQLREREREREIEIAIQFSSFEYSFSLLSTSICETHFISTYYRLRRVKLP